MNLLNHNISVSDFESIQPKTALKPRLHSLALFDDMYAYYNCSRVYYSYFGEIPNIYLVKHLDPQKVIRWMESRYASEIANEHYRTVSNGRGKGFSKTNVIYVLRNQLIVGLEGDHSVRIYFTSASEEQARTMAGQLEQLIEKTAKHHLSIVIDKGNGMELTNFRLKKPVLNLATHFNDDLAPMHASLVKRLNQRNRCGLVLLHGAPGTGKSTYLRYLVHQLKKKVLFFPSKFANTLDSPEVTNLLCQHPNSVVVIEDAESLLSCRDSGYNGNLSMLLNVTDGVLGETLKIHVIATFNTKLSTIDKALLRKGRLVARYEFGALSPEKSKALLIKQNVKDAPSTAMTLAEIFNYPEPSFTFREDSKGMGFKMAR